MMGGEASGTRQSTRMLFRTHQRRLRNWSSSSRALLELAEEFHRWGRHIRARHTSTDMARIDVTMFLSSTCLKCFSYFLGPSSVPYVQFHRTTENETYTTQKPTSLVCRESPGSELYKARCHQTYTDVSPRNAARAQGPFLSRLHQYLGAPSPAPAAQLRGSLPTRPEQSPRPQPLSQQVKSARYTQGLQMERTGSNSGEIQETGKIFQTSAP